MKEYNFDKLEIEYIRSIHGKGIVKKDLVRITKADIVGKRYIKFGKVIISVGQEEFNTWRKELSEKCNFNKKAMNDEIWSRIQAYIN